MLSTCFVIQFVSVPVRPSLRETSILSGHVPPLLGFANFPRPRGAILNALFEYVTSWERFGVSGMFCRSL